MRCSYLMFCFVIEFSVVPRVSLWLDLQFKVNLIMEMGGDRKEGKKRGLNVEAVVFKRRGTVNLDSHLGILYFCLQLIATIATDCISNYISPTS